LTGLRRNAEAKEGGGVRGWPVLSSAALASLLLCEVASSMVGAEAVFFSALVLAWLVLPAVVGLKNVLDAGCLFMLVSLGIVVVVDVAHHGPDSLLT
jgi:sterol desaturase/sphingolipid hydroxylase (fatty acid hydroxylase superfamily)